MKHPLIPRQSQFCNIDIYESVTEDVLLIFRHEPLNLHVVTIRLILGCITEDASLSRT